MVSKIIFIINIYNDKINFEFYIVFVYTFLRAFEIHIIKKILRI